MQQTIPQNNGGGLAETTSAEAYYFEQLAKGSFKLQQCDDCNRAHFYPRVVCPHCGSRALSWHESEGHGVVYSTTTVHGRNENYNVCLVNLDEGVRLLSRVEGMKSQEVSIGMRVRSQIIQEDDKALLVFVNVCEERDSL